MMRSTKYMLGAGALLLWLLATRARGDSGYPVRRPIGECQPYRNGDGIIVIPICK